MAETATARSPLGHLPAPSLSTALTLHEKPFHGMVLLRLDIEVAVAYVRSQTGALV